MSAIASKAREVEKSSVVVFGKRVSTTGTGTRVPIEPFEASGYVELNPPIRGLKSVALARSDIVSTEVAVTNSAHKMQLRFRIPRIHHVFADGSPDVALPFKTEWEDIEIPHSSDDVNTGHSKFRGLVTRRGYTAWRQEILRNIRDKLNTRLFGNTDGAAPGFDIRIGPRLSGPWSDVTQESRDTELMNVFHFENLHRRTLTCTQVIENLFFNLSDGAAFFRVALEFGGNGALCTLNAKAGGMILPSVRYSPLVDALVGDGSWYSSRNTPTFAEHAAAKRDKQTTGAGGGRARVNFPDLYIFYLTSLPVEPTPISIQEDLLKLGYNTSTESLDTVFNSSSAPNLLDLGINATALAGDPGDSSFDLQVIPNPARERGIKVQSDGATIGRISWNILTMDHFGTERPFTLGPGGQVSIQMVISRRDVETIV